MTLMIAQEMVLDVFTVFGASLISRLLRGAFLYRLRGKQLIA